MPSSPVRHPYHLCRTTRVTVPVKAILLNIRSEIHNLYIYYIKGDISVGIYFKIKFWS
jgi:hypothetical protein